MKQADLLQQVIEAMKELIEDLTVPRNVRTKIEAAAAALQSNQELSIRIDKAMQQLDEMANDPNTQPYTRAQIWNIVSMLESVSS
ncbi:MAG: UPF0147 family protein [Candidatus Woesearchaeota archaeon]